MRVFYQFNLIWILKSNVFHYFTTSTQKNISEMDFRLYSSDKALFKTFGMLLNSFILCTILPAPLKEGSD